MDNVIAAVIALALKQYTDDNNHDLESYVITIKRKEDAVQNKRYRL